jgi:hypothetical protein
MPAIAVLIGMGTRGQQACTERKDRDAHAAPIQTSDPMCVIGPTPCYNGRRLRTDAIIHSQVVWREVPPAPAPAEGHQRAYQATPVHQGRLQAR